MNRDIAAKPCAAETYPAEIILPAYLVVAIASILLLSPSGEAPMVISYLIAAVFVFLLSRMNQALTALVRSARILFPLALFSPLYTGTGLISSALPHWTFSVWLERIEAGLFRGQPSMYLAQLFPSLALSETLHAAYVSYYFLVAALPLVLVIRRKERFAAQVVFTLCLCFSLCCLCYIWLPVASPFFIYPPFGPPLSDGFFYQLAHGISNRGGVRGGAFPSSHAALTMVNLLLAWRLERRLFWVTLVPSGLLLGATVYCRYHYALDTIAGAALAVAVIMAARLSWPGIWRDHEVKA
jgi:membrane-associated phospholipid phosphatase